MWKKKVTQNEHEFHHEHDPREAKRGKSRWLIRTAYYTMPRAQCSRLTTYPVSLLNKVPDNLRTGPEPFIFLLARPPALRVLRFVNSSLVVAAVLGAYNSTHVPAKPKLKIPNTYAAARRETPLWLRRAPFRLT